MPSAWPVRGPRRVRLRRDRASTPCGSDASADVNEFGAAWRFTARRRHDRPAAYPEIRPVTDHVVCLQVALFFRGERSLCSSGPFRQDHFRHHTRIEGEPGKSAGGFGHASCKGRVEVLHNEPQRWPVRSLRTRTTRASPRGPAGATCIIACLHGHFIGGPPPRTGSLTEHLLSASNGSSRDRPVLPHPDGFPMRGQPDRSIALGAIWPTVAHTTLQFRLLV